MGLDGASLPLIQAWRDSGKLPGFSRLIKDGGWGGLRSTVPVISPSAWTSIFTGVTPAKHGIFGFVKRRENSYFPRPIGTYDVQVPLLWDILTQHNLRSAWVTIPFVYPPSPINGIMITGLGTPSKKSEFVYPPTLKEDLLRRYPNFDVDFNEYKIELSRDIAESLPKIEEQTNASIELFEDLTADKNNRLVAGVFRAPDVVQHYRIHEPNALLPFYERFDELIQRCLASLSADDVLIVCSDHGFREVKRTFHISNWLENLGLLEMKEKPFLAKIGLSAETFQRIFAGLGLKNLTWRVKRSRAAETIVTFLPRSDIAPINWNRTKAYYIGKEGGGTIYLNMVGREPEGSVKKGPESKELSSMLLAAAREVTDPATGKKPVGEAFETAEFYEQCAPDAPEILLVENEQDDYAFSGRYNYTKELFSDVTRSGAHSIEGILFMGGGRVLSKRIRSACVWDLSPTILHLLGVPIPLHIDGRVLGEALRGFSPEQVLRPPSGSQEIQHIAEAVELLKQSGKV